MTIEEMIKIAKGLRTDFKCESDTMVDFCNTIIKALEQEPCDDCISRQATVERLCKVADFMNEKRKGLGSPYIMAALFIQDNKDEFPSVTPKEKIGWIPVSERLPEKTGWYITTFKGAKNTYGVSELSYRKPENYWTGVDISKKFLDNDDIIAWMPMPEPYKEET